MLFLRAFILFIARSKRQFKTGLKIAVDLLFFNISFTISIYLTVDAPAIYAHVSIFGIYLIGMVTLIGLMLIFGIYSTTNRYTSLQSPKYILLIVVLTITSQYFATLAMPLNFPLNSFLMAGLFSVVTLIGTRLFVQQIFQSYSGTFKKPVAIYGAGVAGTTLLNSLENSPEYIPMVLIDDDPKLQGSKYNGIEIVSFETAILRLNALHIKTVLLAIPSINSTRRKKIIEKLTSNSFRIKSVPSFTKLVEGQSEITNFTNISVDELLGRDIVPPIDALMTQDLQGKSILITGAGGSIGSELCYQVIFANPKKLVLYEQSEYNLYKLRLKIDELCKTYGLYLEIIPILGLVQNKAKLDRIFTTYDIDTIYHAAAYKHVPLVELNITEAIVNNIKSTDVIAQLAHKHNVTKFVLVSSDKAVRPTNYMGASKRVSELICQAYAQSKGNTTYSIVRFGNVLGSSGSVFPHFKKQILAGGPVTVTHPKITRFFMTVTEAAQLVIQAGALAKGGEIFILDMGKPVKIIDLAKKMVKLHGLEPFIKGQNETGDIEIQITGTRPGEKLYEELLIDNDVKKTIHKRIMASFENSISLSTLNPILKELYQACDNFDGVKIETIFHKLPIELHNDSIENDGLLSDHDS